MGSQLWENHHVPVELKENLAELFPGLTIEEALQHQESLYQSLKISNVNQTARYSDNELSSSHGYSWGESSLSGSGDYDLALDEAVARSLQDLDLEDEGDHVAISEPVHSASRNSEHAAVGISVSEANQHDVDPDRMTYEEANQHDVDPDRMTYEELQTLGEAIGSENRGLSEREISSLPCYKYRSGFFSKKIENGDCVICYSAYRKRQSVTTLPCEHQYHSECINRWLRLNKSCPICQKEVKFS